jgi:hypothetical protein
MLKGIHQDRTSPLQSRYCQTVDTVNAKSVKVLHPCANTCEEIEQSLTSSQYSKFKNYS